MLHLVVIWARCSWAFETTLANICICSFCPGQLDSCRNIAVVCIVARSCPGFGIRAGTCNRLFWILSNSVRIVKGIPVLNEKGCFFQGQNLLLRPVPVPDLMIFFYTNYELNLKCLLVFLKPKSGVSTIESDPNPCGNRPTARSLAFNRLCLRCTLVFYGWCAFLNRSCADISR